MLKKFNSDGMRKWAGIPGSHFRRVHMLRQCVLGAECRPVLQLRDVQHCVEEGDGLMFLHSI